MNKTSEKQKVQNSLLIPISDITFQNEYIEIYSGGIYIGGIPYYKTRENIIYDNSENVVNKLYWVAVYDNNKEEINNLIEDIGIHEEEEIVLATYRRLYIRNTDGEINKSVICRFEENKWKVELQ